MEYQSNFAFFFEHILPAFSIFFAVLALGAFSWAITLQEKVKELEIENETLRGGDGDDSE